MKNYALFGEHTNHRAKSSKLDYRNLVFRASFTQQTNKLFKIKKERERETQEKAGEEG